MGLRKRGHKRLAVDLNVYLQEDVEDKSYPSKRYKDLMAEEVVEAIKNEGTKFDEYRRLFLAYPALGTPSHVALDDVHEERLFDRIVSLSLEVDVTG